MLRRSGRGDGALAGPQIGAEHFAFVEHKAAALVVRGANLLEVFEDAAFELIDVLDAAVLHQQRGFFATDAAGAEGHHGLPGEVGSVLFDSGGEFAELADAKVHAVGKAAEIALESIAGVEQHDRAAFVVASGVEPGPQALGRHRRGAPGFGADLRAVQGDDLALDFHLHALEGLRCRERFLRAEVGQPGVGSQGGHDGVDGAARSGEKQVDALGREKDGALELQRRALRRQSRLQRGQVVEADELVAGDVDHGGRGSR